MFFQENAVETAIKKIGGPTRASNVLKVSNACVHKWVAARRVPNIEKAEVLAKLSKMPIEKLRPV